MKISTFKQVAIVLFVGLTMAFVVSAQGSAQVEQGITSLGKVVNTFTSTVVKAVGTLLLALAVVAFFWGIVQYIWAKRAGDAAKLKVGGEFMAWGLIALFVMFSVYGIIRFAQGILLPGQNTSTITIPTIELQGSGARPGNPPPGGTVPQANPANPGVGGVVNPFGGTTATGGCTVVEGSCNNGNGVCKQNTETGELYCAAKDTSTGTGGAVETGVGASPY